MEDQFDVLTAGKIPPNPAELVGSEKMSQLLSYLKETYDYIIIDTPPVLSVTDPQLLALKADGTLMVIREGKARQKLILNAYKELKKLNINVIGSILNDCGQKMGGYSQYYYQYEDQSVNKKRLFGRKNK